MTKHHGLFNRSADQNCFQPGDKPLQNGALGKWVAGTRKILHLRCCDLFAYRFFCASLRKASVEGLSTCPAELVMALCIVSGQRSTPPGHSRQPKSGVKVTALKTRASSNFRNTPPLKATCNRYSGSGSAEAIRIVILYYSAADFWKALDCGWSDSTPAAVPHDATLPIRGRAPVRGGSCHLP